MLPFLHKKSQYRVLGKQLSSFLANQFRINSTKQGATRLFRGLLHERRDNFFVRGNELNLRV